MSSDTDNKQVIVVKSGPGCVGWFAILLLAGIVLLGMGGAAVLDGASQRARVEVLPHLPINTADLGIQPSTVVIEPRPTAMPPVVVYQPEQAPAVMVPFVGPACTVPSDWRLGVSPLPDCWESLTREEQNAIIRSH